MSKKKNFLTPQQELFLSLLTNPQSKTFGNYCQSAIQAKYSKSYAENITELMPSWLSENIGDMKLLNKAVKALDETLDENYNVQAMGAFGPVFDKETKQPIFKVDSSIMRNKIDAAKFVASTVGKKRFSTRSNLLDDEGRPIPVPIYNGQAAKTVEVQGHNSDEESISAS